MRPREPGAVEFAPVRIGRRRHGIDPTAAGFLIVTVAILAAVVKPWGAAGPESAVEPVATPGASPGLVPTDRPPPSTPPAVAHLPPTWASVAKIVSRHESWGIRAILLGSGGVAGAPDEYRGHWFPDRLARPVRVAPGVDAVVALGVTFPPAETPLAVRIWLERGDGQLEWIDARPIDEVPARGAHLFVRSSPSSSGRAGYPGWEPGRYRIDVLVGQAIRRTTVEILDRTGELAEPVDWPDVVPPIAGPPGTGLQNLPTGPFAVIADTPLALASEPGPPLDETGAWLDLDLEAAGIAPRSHVASTYQPRTALLGVVLPPASTVRSATLHRLAPLEATDDLVGATTLTSGDDLSFVAFARPGGATWRPGVYALRVEFDDDGGPHDLTWHVELRPGPTEAEPILLSATRAWAGFAGSSGVLLGATEAVDGAAGPPGVRLLDIVPQTGAVYPGLGGPNLIGCGQTIVHGVPSLVGVVGPGSASLGPVTATILFPLADDGPLPVLTATGAVPGLAIAVPVLTAEFGGPALYGFRAGPADDASGYTICVGMGLPGR